MAITDSINTEWDEKYADEKFFEARALLQHASGEINRAALMYDSIIADPKADFSSLPADIKTAMQQWRAILQTFRVSMNNNADVMALYGWRP